MTSCARRKPIALLFCYGFASVLVGGHAGEAQAQAPAPLRVDPALLGLPPITPAQAPAPAPAPLPAEKASVEVKPVEPDVVEARPVTVEAQPAAVATEKSRPAGVARDSKPAKAAAQEIPARTVAPQEPPPVAAPEPSPASAAAVSPVVAAPARDPREEARQAAPVGPETQTVKQPEPVPQAAVPAVQTQARSAPAPAVAASPAVAATPVATVAPLRVDPALLAAPSVAAPPTAAPVPAAAATGSRVAGGVPSSAPVAGETPAPPAKAKTAATTTATAGAGKSWFRRIWDPVANAYDNGALEFYLPLETYHSRSTYSAEQIASYQEQPLGFGVGRGLYNEKGNWEGVYAMAFQDSHFKPSYTAGYGWKAIWRPAEDVRVGLGFLAGLMSRSDILGYVPFPIIVPLASVSYKNFSLEGTYIPPGGQDAGNVIFIWAKWELGKTGEAIGTPARPAPPEPVQVATTGVGAAMPLAVRRVPYGPTAAGGTEAGVVAPSANVPPLVSAAGSRDEEAVPDASPALALRMSRTMEPLAKDSTVPRPVFLNAQRMAGEIDREFIAEEDAELRKIGTTVNADRLTYWPIDDEIQAEGNVRLEQGEDVITGPKMRLKIEDQVGYFEQPSYTIKRQPLPGSKAAADKAFAASPEGQAGGDSWLNSGFATPRVLDIKPGQTRAEDSTKMRSTMTEGRGEADRIDFEGENQVRMTNSTYTTCEPGNDDWYAKASSLKLDYDREVADGTDGAVYFLGVPILYSPWLSFSLNNERKSGLLAPSFGTTSDSGIELALPYYWNIAPNMDATITPRIMTKRGTQFGTEFRYLNTAYGGLFRGQARAEYLPGDKVRDEDRWGLSLRHQQTTANGFSGQVNYNKVSDDNYFTDLSSGIAQTSQTQLLQQGSLSYGAGGWWTATANVQQYQTLQPDSANPVSIPYKLLPQITVNARKPDLFMTDSSFLGQYTNFTINERVQNGTIYPDGQRTVLYPQVALPYVTPGWYITPKLGVNFRNYALSGQAAGTPGSLSTTLPIVSVDSGMTFERTSNWFGRDYTQTLEPRLYYLNVPYKNQDQIPLFDTGLADFNFAQIFSENQFSGWDRISNANQLTAAVTTRLLEPATGNEIMRAMVGERFYFSKNKVALTPGTNTTSSDGRWDRSDVLAAFSGQILPKVYADSALQYNVADAQVKRFSLGTRYQPEPGKVLNAAYRYNRDASAPIDQVDFSGQWPITGRLYAVGRYNYSFQDDGTNTGSSTQGGRVIQAIAGLEYNGGCWIVRGVVQRLALTQDTATTSFFIQLELSDFSRIGSNPLNLLKRNIQGYSLINQPAMDAVLGE